MTDTKELVKKWFTLWEDGNFEDLPLEDNFNHISPYGTINTKKAYLKMVEANRSAFLGGKFIIHDEVYDAKKACVRYTMQKDSFEMEVSEWIYIGIEKIKEIVSYYNVGNVSYEKNLTKPD